MHDTPPPAVPPDPTPRRSSVVPLAVSTAPHTTDHVPTIIGENPFAPSQPAAFDLPPGSTLGHFEVTAPLGAGGMATVFRAKDTTLGREVALKILPPALTADADAVARFKFEARAAAKLNHDHVARVFYIGEDRGLHFIAFEYVDGRTLRDLIDAGGPVAPADALRYLFDTAIGLQHAAERGVVHRDVKPSNIVITPDGRAKLIDMGLARSVDPHSVHGGVTQSGITLGTFDYISPEQAIDPRRADVRADIYSLGCTFYHALTGQPPVPEGNAARKLAAHQSECPTDPRLINPEVPDALAAVLDRMLAKKPEHRHQTAGELIADLGRVAHELGLPDGGGESKTISVSAARPVASRRTLLPVVSLAVGGAVVVFAVVVALTTGGLSRSGPPAVPWTDPPVKQTAPAEVLPADPIPPRATPAEQAVTSRDELLKALKDGVPRVMLAAGVYDLTDTEGVVLSGKGVELDGTEGVVLRVAAGPRADKPSDPRPGTLTFHKCESVKLRGLRVEVAHAGDAPRPVGLLFADVPTVDVSDCRFVLLSAVATDGAMVAFARTGSVAVKHGFFASKGWAGVELVGGMRAEFTECGFVTSRAGIELVPATDSTTATVSATHVTFLLNGTSSAAVSVGKGARCEFAAGHCLFAAPPPAEPGMMIDMPRKPAVVRSDSPDALSFTVQPGTANAAFGVDTQAVATTLDTLPVSPWAVPRDPADPFAPLELNVTLPPLRVGVGQRDILGVRHWREGKSLYPGWPLPPLATPGVVIWHPKLDPADKEKGLVPANVYDDLNEAVSKIKGSGTLLIRGSGKIEMPLVVLTDPKRKLRLKPDEKCQFTLVPEAGDRRESILFRLEAGELVFDGLQFALQPGAKADAAAVVAVSGGKRCEFRTCVFTLNEGPNERTAVVSLSDAADQMPDKTEKPERFIGRPMVALENCLVRGRGRVVRAGGTVPADVSLTNVAVATDGAPAFDLGPPTRSGGPLSVQLTHVTAALGGPLVDVRGGRRPFEDKPPVVKVDVTADNCLFVAFDASTEPLLRANAFDQMAIDRLVTWSASGNAYAGWAAFAELTLDDPDPKRWDRADWRRWSGDTTAAGGLFKTPTAKTAPAVRPADLEPATDTSAGVKTKALPQPIED